MMRIAGALEVKADVLLAGIEWLPPPPVGFVFQFPAGGGVAFCHRENRGSGCQSAVVGLVELRGVDTLHALQSLPVETYMRTEDRNRVPLVN